MPGNLPKVPFSGLFFHKTGSRSTEPKKTLYARLMAHTTKKRSLTPSPSANVLAVLPNSGVTPDAQCPTLCAVPDLESRRSWGVQVVEKVAREKSHRDAIAIDLLIFSGCRVSEVCNIVPEDILSNTQVYVHGLKGSEDRVCTLAVMTDFLDFKYRLCWFWGAGLNRWYLYRLCKEYGIYEEILGNKRLAVTHSGRHEFISGLASAGLEKETIAKVVGHKRVSSTEHYLKHRSKNGFLGDDKKI